VTARLGEPLIRLGRTTSTMDELAALAAAGAAEGTAVLAEAQTAGRGRAGRHWQSPPGTAILLSVLLRPTVPPTRLGVLPLVVGLAVAEAVEAEAGLSPWLKWPNDVLLDGRKLAGILAAARTEGTETRVILGIGLNVNARRDQLPPEAASLKVELGREQDREPLLAALLDRLDGAYRRFESEGGAFEPAEWECRAAFLGETVLVADAGRTLQGVFRGVDGDGALILDLGVDGRRPPPPRPPRAPARRPAPPPPPPHGRGLRFCVARGVQMAA
jgi:BirA family transcriptional regulator, biotin operon repressor / biotin---[acetyl-CoA-carboxylase] ligase